MKKTLLLSLTALASALTVNVNSQTQLSVRTKTEKGHSATGVEKQVAGSLTCNTQYTAGTTMDLTFTLSLTNTDLEYCDLFTLTFPTGITPNTSASNTNPMNSATLASGQTATQLNPIAGQSISWGTDDDAAQYGGIEAGTPYTFTVNVTIAGGTTGNLTATFIADGDTYGSTPGDLSGSATIYPVGASVIDVFTDFTQPATITSLQNCGLGTIDVVTRVKNLSTVSVSNIPVKYSVNGGTVVSEVIAGPILAGDSIDYTFTTASDFSAQNVYSLQTWTEMSGDVAATNDTATIVFANSVTTTLPTTAYTNGFENDYDFVSTNMGWIGVGTGFSLSGSTFHTGALALYLTIPTNAPAADYESHAVMPCMDVVAGQTYRISYWKKSNDTPAANGMSGIFCGTAQDAASMTTVIKAYSALTPNAQTGVWAKDSADYVATTTGTMYFSIGGKGTIAATAPTQVNVRIDDINIQKITTGGLAENNIVSSAFPNPASDVFNIELNTVATKVSIIGMDGKIVSTKDVNSNSISLNVANLNAGVYLYEIVSSNGTVSRSTFVKK